MYRMDVLERRLSYNEVTEIFVRVNSLGAKLRSSDLALAQITAKWRNSLKTFQSFQEKCEKLGFDLDLGLHLKNLVAFATGQSRFLTDASGSRPCHAPAGRRRYRDVRQAASPSRPSRRDSRGARGPQPAQRTLQDDVFGVSG